MSCTATKNKSHLGSFLFMGFEAAKTSTPQLSKFTDSYSRGDGLCHEKAHGWLRKLTASLILFLNASLPPREMKRGNNCKRKDSESPTLPLLQVEGEMLITEMNTVARCTV